MIPNPDAFEPTGDPLIDTALKLNLLSQNQEIAWTRHAEDPRSPDDRYAQRESDGVGQWFTYQPEDADWTFLVYELSQPEGTTVFPHIDERTRHPHLQLLDKNQRVARDFQYRDVLNDRISTVYHRSRVDDGAHAFIAESTRAYGGGYVVPRRFWGVPRYIQNMTSGCGVLLFCIFFQPHCRTQTV